MKTRALSLPLIAAVVGAFALVIFAAPKVNAEPKAGAVRVLFLGHESEHHNSNKFYPMLAKGLGGMPSTLITSRASKRHSATRLT